MRCLLLKYLVDNTLDNTIHAGKKSDDMAGCFALETRLVKFIATVAVALHNKINCRPLYQSSKVYFRLYRRMRKLIVLEKKTTVLRICASFLARSKKQTNKILLTCNFQRGVPAPSHALFVGGGAPVHAGVLALPGVIDLEEEERAVREDHLGAAVLAVAHDDALAVLEPADLGGGVALGGAVEGGGLVLDDHGRGGVAEDPRGRG